VPVGAPQLREQLGAALAVERLGLDPGGALAPGDEGLRVVGRLGEHRREIRGVFGGSGRGGARVAALDAVEESLHVSLWADP
jgi:hypothetical protein